jgi:hypothetical protein
VGRDVGISVGEPTGELVGNSVVGLGDPTAGVVVGIAALGDSVGELTGFEGADVEGGDVAGASDVGELTVLGATVDGCPVEV